MPRPKRTKISHPAPLRRAGHAILESPVNSTSKRTVAEFEEGDQASDEARAVVTSARRLKKGIITSLGGDHARNKTTGLRLHGTESEDEQLEDGEHSAADHSPAITLGDLELDESSLETEAGRRDVTVSRVENSVLDVGNFRRRPRQPSILGRGDHRASSVDSNPAERIGPSTMRGSVMSTTARQSTQAGRWSSVESEDGAIRSSSPMLSKQTPAQVGSSVRLSSFRRRDRQPSILGTAQKDRQSRPTYEVEEDDFDPEDESTPLHLSKTIVTTSPSPQPSNPRKRKLSPNSDTHTSPMADAHSGPLTGRSNPKLGDAEDSDQTRDDASHTSIERSPSPELASDTLASHRSSSALPGLQDQAQASSRIVIRNARTPLPPPTQSSSPLPSSPPSLTHSPNYPTRGPGRSRSKAPPATFSTAQLTALLPRRRLTRIPTNDPFDMLPSSEDEEIDVTGLREDEDELSHLDARARVRRNGRRGRSTALEKAKLGTGSGPKAKTKVKQPALAKRIAGMKPAKRLEGSLFPPVVTSDKENSPHPSEIDPNDSLAPIPDDEGQEESSQELEVRVGKELKRAKRKFEDVDKWQLDFEEETASSSSPAFRDAR